MACRERGAGIFILLIGGGVFCLRGRIGTGCPTLYWIIYRSKLRFSGQIIKFRKKFYMADKKISMMKILGFLSILCVYIDVKAWR